MEQPLRVLVEVPFCAFRPYTSREYQDTFPLPTPSSVYGMFLSFAGVPREDKARHRGVAMALAVEGLPERTRVFRKFRRGDDLDSLRPDYQDLLLDVRLWVWLKPGDDRARPNLPECVARGLREPHTLTRFGGLSLGESSYLVNSISTRFAPPSELRFLSPDPAGFYNLPVWVDHSDARQTQAMRFSIGEQQSVDPGLATAWFKVGAS